MVQVHQYRLPPTALIPNSPRPVLHYPAFFALGISTDQAVDGNEDGREGTHWSLAQIHEKLRSNGWQSQWIYRYGRTQSSHYHSRVHECMVVLSGSATIRFGVADTSSDLNESTYGEAKEQGGIEIDARVGDVFVVPAVVAHKTFNAMPRADFALLTPGDGHGSDVSKQRADRAEGSVDLTDSGDGDGHSDDPFHDALESLSVDGFTMMGAYPVDAADWDFAQGGGDEGRYEQVWNTAKPVFDPVLRSGDEGLCGVWE